MVIGLDGTKGGWIGIKLDDHGRFAGDCVLRPMDTDFLEVAGCEVAIDVPIGFGPRQADTAARAYLGPRRGSVFPVPDERTVRNALKAKRYSSGLGVSAQFFGIAPRVVHVTELVATGEGAAPKLYEIHPEVSFQAMNNDQPLRYAKRAYGGVHERLELLGTHKIELGGLSEDAKAIPIDDVLDAAAAAWSARRIKDGDARTFPDPPETRGPFRVAIWC